MLVSCCRQPLFLLSKYGSCMIPATKAVRLERISKINLLHKKR